MSLFSFVMTYDFFDMLTMHELGLLALVATAPTCAMSQLGQLPKKFIWGDLGLLAPLL